ncbi:MAG: hypothetical protein WB762_22675 [Candidatus Sulfotelmatobacter sp.]
MIVPNRSPRFHGSFRLKKADASPAQSAQNEPFIGECALHTTHRAELEKLADLKLKTLAIMHGSSFTGDCARALDNLNVALREVFGPQK